MGLAGKLKQVTLSDGHILTEMSGAMAPALWHEGEREAVLAYLLDDVRLTLELAQAVATQRRLVWHNKRGELNQLVVPTLYRVADCLQLPRPKLTGRGFAADVRQITIWLQ
jgi:hypothetical protein